MYGKLFASMYDGTLRADWKALVTFQQFIVLADAQGVVDMTPHAIHGRTGIPLDIIEHGIQALMAPDPYSRSEEMEGRRLVLLDESRPWGWRIVNYPYYRNLASATDKREKDRQRIAKKRRSVSQPVAGSRWPSQKVADVAHTEAKAKAEAHKGTAVVKPLDTGNSSTSGNSAPGSAKTADTPALTAQTWNAYAEHYRVRYGVEPVRNAKVNGMLVKFIQRIGEYEAPAVAAFYVGHDRALYVNSKHCIDLLLRDAEGLRTEWATGNKVSDTGRPSEMQRAANALRSANESARGHSAKPAQVSGPTSGPGAATGRPAVHRGRHG